ncbi:MAG: LptF/LptG family permease [Verrucomicrobiota bacterium]
MKIVYRYMGLALLKPFLFCCFAFCALMVIVDLFNVLGDFTKNQPEWHTIVLYYLVQIPQMGNLIIPISYFISLLYLLTTLSQTRELIALQAAGISLTRVSVPFFIIGAISSVALFFFFLDLAPSASQSAEAYRARIEGKSFQSEIYPMVIYDNPDTHTTWFLQELDLEKKKFTQGEILITDSMGNDQEKLFAAAGNYIDGKWNLARVRKVRFLPGRPSPPAEDIDYMDAPFLSEEPHQLVAAMRTPSEMPWVDLYQFITTKNPHTEIRMAPFRTEHFYRMAYPFLPILLCLFAFGLGITNERQGRAGALFNCLIILASMLTWIYFTKALGDGNRIPAWLASWNAMILFGALGIYLYASKVGWIWNLLDLLKARSVKAPKKSVDLNEMMGPE